MVDRAENSTAAAVQDMCVDFRRLDVRMSQQFLNGAQIVATFEKMGGEGMAKRVATAVFENTTRAHGALDGALGYVGAEVMALLAFGMRIYGSPVGWENILPGKRLRRRGVLTLQGIGQGHLTEAFV